MNVFKKLKRIKIQGPVDFAAHIDSYLKEEQFYTESKITMKDSTETLVMFAQLLEAKPPILQPDALPQVQKLAADLEQLSDGDINQAAELIMTWMEQFPQAEKAIQKAREQNRKEVKKIPEPDPNQSYSLIPNVEIIEETERTVIITQAPKAEKISLFLYVKQTLNRWTQKNP
ncbi:hypothetical protein [Oscillatoria acuminata]|uniref:Uncharacterized protein n=1 Tax=Oscillatoria acuminata PCC 6304 TaxID=56110 RepID=K9TLI2_9CYAN|nr:hypothetical protein [Oscillatoria acuminata]AFY83011.1 hypothetical protein Oscil6304_3443 [Oscillatoria acuminata PCC 6304]